MLEKIDADGIENSKDPDQADPLDAVRPGSALSVPKPYASPQRF